MHLLCLLSSAGMGHFKFHNQWMRFGNRSPRMSQCCQDNFFLKIKVHGQGNATVARNSSLTEPGNEYLILDGSLSLQLLLMIKEELLLVSSCRTHTYQCRRTTNH